MQLLAAALVAALAAEPRMRVRDGRIIDAHGRVRTFHGFNDVQAGKTAPYLPGPTYRAAENVAALADMGFNVMRVPVMLSGVMPDGPGRFNDTLLEELRAHVTRLHDAGIYSVLDMHQDLFSEVYGGDGMPGWVANATHPRHPYPYPFKSRDFAVWAEGYLTTEVGEQFQALYTEGTPAREAWVAMWQRVARAFKDVPGVLGYEVLNEPWGGDVFADPLLLDPRTATSRNLLPSYDAVTAAIAAEDDATLVFIEPPVLGNVLPDGGAGAFPRLPTGVSRDRYVIAWHYYCWVVNFAPPVPGPFAPAYNFGRLAACDAAIGPVAFAHNTGGARRLGAATFLTEFGDLVPTPAGNTTADRELQAVLDLADQHFESWTYWDVFHLLLPDGHTLSRARLAAFARPYPTATAGTPVASSYDAVARRFTYSFRPDPSIDAPTVITAPAHLYPRGVAVEVTPRGGVAAAAACEVGGRAGFVCVTGGAGVVVTVTVAPPAETSE